MEDIGKIKELCSHMKSTSLCALGQTTPNPVISTMHYFEDEYIAHVKDKTCPAGVCKDLLKYQILPDKCKGCTLCARNCPVDAISGAAKSRMLLTERNVSNAVCVCVIANSELLSRNKEVADKR